MSDDTILEALEFSIAEKERRLEYYKTQVTQYEDDIKRLRASAKALQSKMKKTLEGRPVAEE